VPSTFATGSNTRQPIRPDGTRDARFGTTDSYFLLDLTARAQLTEWAKLFAGVKNLTDKEYIASRIPHGPRPGAPRLFHAGLEVTF
jgi:Fe(3+) dicitrate transport protein